jgi:hypothetical protein
MIKISLESLQYPIGKFKWVENPTPIEIKAAIGEIEAFPKALSSLCTSFTESDLEKTYRQEGWTVAQVLHHIADSHMHCYLRLKHAVLEETPTIKSYNESDWANTTDGNSLSIVHSVSLIKALHQRWCLFLSSLNPIDLEKCYFHPERKKHYSVGATIMLYAWHGKHHLAHLKIATKK